MIIYRTTKGAPLTNDEMDGNFKDLDTRLQTLETGTLRAEKLAKMTYEKGKLTLFGSHGSILGPVDVPQEGWYAKGSWQAGTHYDLRDVVYTPQGAYLCTKAHTTGNDFDPVYWQPLCLWPATQPKTGQSFTKIPLVDKSALTQPATLGDMAMLMGDTPQLIFYTGEQWITLQTQPTVI